MRFKAVQDWDDISAEHVSGRFRSFLDQGFLDDLAPQDEILKNERVFGGAHNPVLLAHRLHFRARVPFLNHPHQIFVFGAIHSLTFCQVDLEDTDMPVLL